MCKNKINVNNYESFDFDNFSYGLVKMPKSGSKIKTTYKNKKPKGHQSSMRKGLIKYD